MKESMNNDLLTKITDMFSIFIKNQGPLTTNVRHPSVLKSEALKGINGGLSIPELSRATGVSKATLRTWGGCKVKKK